MSIDPVSIKLSGAVAMQKGHILTSKTLIEKVNSTLKSVGWTSVGVAPSGGLSYPLGFPVVTGPGTGSFASVDCTFPFVRIDGVKIIGYNPFSQIPVGGSCVYFAYGETMADGLDNLCVAIEQAGPYIATWSVPAGGIVVSILCTVLGPEKNYIQLVGDGRWGVGSAFDGGGYELTSVAEARTSQYTVKVNARGLVNPYTRVSTKPVYFDFLTPHNAYGTAVLALDADDRITGDGYTILANPYSFVIFDSTNPNTTSVWAAAPYIPTNYQLAYTLFVVYPTVTDRTFWQTGTVWLDAPPVSYLGTSYIRLQMLRNPGVVPLVGPSGVPVITTALIMYNYYTVDAKIVGQLWDCAAITDMIGGTVINGIPYTAIASQSGASGKTRSTLLMRSKN